MPWRKGQKILRKDFWLDAFYMFFNFFLFSLVIYNAASDVVVDLFNGVWIGLTGNDLQGMNPLNSWPMWSVLLVGFVVRDFVQWWVHRLLHAVEWLWRFHQVHHSVKEMGFAAHLRYHWMETIVYRSLEYLPLAMLGIGLYDFFVIHIFTLAWGHYNHSNISVSSKVTGGIIGLLIGSVAALGLADITYLDGLSMPVVAAMVVLHILVGYFALGPFMKKLFNSPDMHIWHHAHDLPAGYRTGANFGITLAIWDYIFGTDYQPHSGRDIDLGFEGVEHFPSDFGGQAIYGLK